MSQHADVTETHTYIKCEFMLHLLGVWGLPRWLSGEEASCQCRRRRKWRFDAWSGSSSREGKWQPTPVFLPGKSHGQRSMEGYSPGVAKSQRWLSTQAHNRNMCYRLLLLSCSVVSNSLWPQGLQHAKLSVLYLLPEFAQTHVHWVSDAIQPSHPLSPPSPPAFNLSHHQGLF